MKLTGNTIFITGGGSGIGRGLAEALHKLGNQIIISGRRKSHLDATTKANPGMASLELNIEDPASIAAVTKKLIAQFPSLNCRDRANLDHNRHALGKIVLPAQTKTSCQREKGFSAAHRKTKTASIGTGLRQEPDSDRARSLEYLYWEATFMQPFQYISRDLLVVGVNPGTASETEEA